MRIEAAHRRSSSRARDGRGSRHRARRPLRRHLETVRRDLTALDRLGALRKVHGGAVPATVPALPETGVAERERVGSAAKQAIARAALPASRTCAAAAPSCSTPAPPSALSPASCRAGST